MVAILLPVASIDVVNSSVEDVTSTNVDRNSDGEIHDSFFISKEQLQHSKDDENKSNSDEKCKLYLAPSSIPGGGLGVYTSTFLPTNSYSSPIHSFDPILSLLDFEMHNNYRKSVPRPLKDYAWSTRELVGGEINMESQRSTSFVPGLGMMCNSHPTLHNVQMTVDNAVTAASFHTTGTSDHYNQRGYDPSA
eukprot:6663899-Ditylum_brightwellii.AAC.1